MPIDFPLVAQVLRTVRAILAFPTDIGQPFRADSIANFEFRYVCANGDDVANSFVAGCAIAFRHAEAKLVELVVSESHVGMADAAVRETDEDFIVAMLRKRDFLDGKPGIGSGIFD